MILLFRVLKLSSLIYYLFLSSFGINVKLKLKGLLLQVLDLQNYCFNTLFTTFLKFSVLYPQNLNLLDSVFYPMFLFIKNVFFLFFSTFIVLSLLLLIFPLPFCIPVLFCNPLILILKVGPPSSAYYLTKENHTEIVVGVGERMRTSTLIDYSQIFRF